MKIRVCTDEDVGLRAGEKNTWCFKLPCGKCLYLLPLNCSG